MRYVCVLVAAVVFIGCGAREQPAEAKTEAPEPRRPGEVVIPQEAQRLGGIEVERADRSSAPEVIRATGQLTVNEERTYSVGAHIEGRIVEVFANPGDLVRQDAVLAHIHGHDVHDSRADYRRAMDELTRARAAASQAHRLRDRAQRLFDLKAASKQDVEMAEGQLRDAEAVVRNAETEVGRIRIHITEYLGIPLRESGESRGGHDDEVPVRTPAAGVVLERKASSGTVVSAGQELFRITDPSSLWMIANVAEADLGHLRIGQPVRVTVRAYPDREFRGRVLRLGEDLDPTTRTLKVRVLVPNTGGLLKPEMFASADIERSGGREVIFVPDAALQDLSGNRVVFVQTMPDRFEARTVQTGRRVGTNVEILAGLNGGESVATRGSFVIKSQMLRSSLEED